MSTALNFPALLRRFFLQHLVQQRHASVQTIAAYRDSFRLLLRFAQQQLGRQPKDIVMEDLNAMFILSFLHHLEVDRHNSVRSRNARFAAIRSFMTYVSYEEPALSVQAQTILAIPMKRFEQPLVGFLSREQMQAILLAPDPATRSGQRDRIMLATLYNTGARASELIQMRVSELTLEPSAWIRIHGKGRKERSVPLWPETAIQLKRWLQKYPRAPDQPLFPNRSGMSLTRVGLTTRLKLAAQRAARQYPELIIPPVFPHLIRHSTAMHMLQAGVDVTVIALWLGHESPATTHRYLEADLAMKEQALQAVEPTSTRLCIRPEDPVMKFLQQL
ncbi:MAG: tyrosine-type recombinase/integrase [Candidatus Thiodiazotropha sp.]|jgi:site-specific recombinase XerD